MIHSYHIYIILQLIAAFVLGGAFFSCICALAAPLKTLPPAKNTARFAILIPARNEASVIGNLIDSLCKQNYPKDAFEVYVLANGCTDETPVISEARGASVMVCEGKFRGKGDVLSYAFDRFAENKAADFDAYIIFDADNVVDPEFLSAMNRAVQTGMTVCQGRRTGKNTYDNTFSRIYELYYTMLNIYYNHVQNTKNCSAIINGTGWMIRKDFIDKHGFSSVTLTEDIEITALVDLLDERVHFVPSAVTYDEYPNDIRTICRQFHRWVFGQVQCMRAYALKIIKKILKDRSFACIGTLGTLILPIFFTLMVILLVWTIFMPAGYPPVLRTIRAFFPLIILAVYAALSIFMAFSVRKIGSSPKRFGAALAFYPLFMCILFPFSVECLFRRNLVWKPITHDRDVKIDDLTDR
ncbi:MAG: glycosyltransferase family 2 protein [Eubacterium sp.]|nr:glycosyltransferase family 2 protein [Eubacterium sp.]